ncbi:MAG TPA: CDP-alcohol phosphatidyltransferase family protein [Thermoanaerobaculia bacterium]|nr:CDP-alcohol phosphatidyltransferase family protein [Thermoanaerobaculia bacterium]
MDLWIYRPLAFLVAWPLRKTAVRPNHVSLASLACGVAAGFSFGSATWAGAILGAIAYFFGNVLDCADGQLARLQSSASPIGYLVDGAADYVGTTAVFVGMAHWLNLQRPAPLNWWWLVVAAGISMAWQCAFLEEKRKEWQRRVYQRSRDRKAELEALARQAAEWRAERTHLAGRVLIAGYRAYRTGWAPLTRSAVETSVPDAGDETRWVECHLPVLRRSVWIGPTMHVTAIVLCTGLLNRPDWYLWAATTIGNLWMIATLVAERRAARCMAE